MSTTSDGVLAGSMFSEAHRSACDMVMSRKSSQASASISRTFFASFCTSANIFCKASSVRR